MAIFDHYGQQTLTAGQHPKPFSHSSTSSYHLDFTTADVLILDTQRAATVSFQIDGSPADLGLALSNQDYRDVDPSVTPAAYSQTTTPEYVSPATPLIWTAIASPTSTFAKLDTTAVSQIRLTVSAALVLHIEMDETPAAGTDWLPSANAVSDPITLVEQEPLYDYLGTGERIDFIRSYAKDATGATLSVIDTLPSGTAYAPAGTVEHTPQRRTMGSDIIKFSDGGVNSFGSIPAGAEYAEYHVWGGDCVITTAGMAPADSIGEGIRLADGASPELESYDEIKGFQVIGQAGESGRIYVEFFSHR